MKALDFLRKFLTSCDIGNDVPMRASATQKVLIAHGSAFLRFATMLLILRMIPVAAKIFLKSIKS